MSGSTGFGARAVRQALLWTVAVGAALGAVAAYGASGERGRVLPKPAQDEAVGSDTSRVAVFAGGCFWGVQGVFQHVEGVTSAVSGYAGGAGHDAHYNVVSGGDTGYAESVQVTYDPRRITYGRLLQVYFSVAHDPTQLNRQGPDVGTEYRSTIFPLTDDQTRIATAYVAQLTAAKAFESRIVTTLEQKRPFFPAEAYHQDYLARNPRAPYIVFNDLPKIAELRRLFPELYRPEPVLVTATSPRPRR